MSSAEGLPLVQRDQFHNTEFNITNRASKILGTAAVCAVAGAAIAGLVVLASHGGSSLASSYGLVGSAALAGVTGLAYGAVKLCRDRPEKNRAEKAWNQMDKGGLKADVAGLHNGDKLTRSVRLGDKDYNVEVVKGGDKVKISSK